MKITRPLWHGLLLGLLTFAAVNATGQPPSPKVDTPTDLTITMLRGGAMDGPTYELTIYGDGRVIYLGKGGVFIRGKRTSHITKAALRDLVGEFHKAHFFELNDSYSSAATDQPTCITTFQEGTLQKRVVDRGGQLNRVAPDSLIALETTIDQIVGTQKWTKGSLLRRWLHWR